MFFHPTFLKAHGQYCLASGRASVLCLLCILGLCTAPACWAVIQITVLHLLPWPSQVVADFFRAPFASALWMCCSAHLPGGGSVKFAPAAAWTSHCASPASVPCRKPHWTSAVSPVCTCLTHTVVIPLEIPNLSVLPA